MGANVIRPQTSANDKATALPRERGKSTAGKEIVWGLFIPPVVTYHPRTIIASQNDGTNLVFQFVSTDDTKVSATHTLPLKDVNAPFRELPNLIPEQVHIDAGLTVGVLMINATERPRSMTDVDWDNLINDANKLTFVPTPPPEKWPRGAEHQKTIKELIAYAEYFEKLARLSHAADPSFLKELAKFDALRASL
jgi:hypothetical protein